MAEEFDTDGREPDHAPTELTRRSRRAHTTRSTTRPAARVENAAPRGESASRARSTKTRSPLARNVVILSMVAGLVATVALPAYAAWKPEDTTLTLQQVSADDSQSLVVASDATAAALERSSYAATTPEEIEKKKAAEAAAERAREVASRMNSSVSVASVDLTMTAPGSGEVRWPLASFTRGRGLGDSGYHQGVDLLASCGQPVFAAAAGVVRVSQESYGGYGVAITIDHVIAGQRVSTLYGHMTYGSRVVQSGESVAAGQLIGLVGSTGSSTACHTHVEVRINDQLVDPYAWFDTNAS